MSPASKAAQKAVAKYENKVYDKFLIRMPKGRKDEIKAAADAADESLNGYISAAIDQRMEREAMTGAPKTGAG